MNGMTWEELALVKGVYLGRNELPAVLNDAFCAEKFASNDELAVGIEHAWTSCEFPLRALDLYAWCEMFEEVGFLEDNLRKRAPKKLRRLYRAATPDYAEGMSWTDDLEKAQWFDARNRNYFKFESAIYTTIPERWNVLAHFTIARNEAEWVIDPAFADIQLLGGAR